ncbi:J domain-containing protein [Clostridium gasigenes]|uniref:DnaJ domain-containing protein n=1 Tax=Clostridium gasigenes TaxID=94869 RepID=A0A1H0QJJ9_9CLOT|nr:DnaJ domain-containing protein [Clostridium gasigenes]SDP16886.1 DnaJ domain-containing protein [Clostridium gasigenes]
MKNYYKTLDISVNATKDEIKKAFRILAKKYHPDRNVNNENALRNFQEINEAYEILGNEDSRKEYDKKISSSKQSNSKDTNSKNNKSSNDNRKSQDKSDSMADLNKYFESLFGFDANTNNIDKDKLKNQKNPIDTSNMFEGFFNIKKK